MTLERSLTEYCTTCPISRVPSTMEIYLSDTEANLRLTFCSYEHHLSSTFIINMDIAPKDVHYETRYQDIDTSLGESA